jgi:hypothetical protein
MTTAGFPHIPGAGRAAGQWRSCKGSDVGLRRRAKLRDAGDGKNAGWQPFAVLRTSRRYDAANTSATVRCGAIAREGKTGPPYMLEKECQDFPRLRQRRSTGCLGSDMAQIGGVSQITEIAGVRVLRDSFGQLSNWNPDCRLGG